MKSKLNIKKISLGAENLSLFQKTLIQKAFNVNPIQHYGLAEGVANISELENGRFRVDEDYSIVEFIKKENDQDFFSFKKVSKDMVSTITSNNVVPFLL